MIAILLFVALVRSQENTCTKPYCYECDASGCVSCIENYVLVGNECKPRFEAYCHDATDGKHCSECFDGYHIHTNGNCVDGEETCSSGYYENGEFKCNSCIGDKFFVNGKCLDCSNDNPYCSELEEDATTCMQCYRCMDGAKMDKNGKCIIFDEYCESNSDEGCEQCVSGYYLDKDGVCKKGTIEGCLYYDSKDLCLQCYNNGYVENGKCVKGCKVQNCEMCTADGESCEECKEGFYQTEDFGECKKLPDHCVSMHYDVEKCQTCEDGYFLDDNKECKEKCADDCETCYETKDTCTSCKDKSKTPSENGKCVKYIDNCDTHTDDGKCESCQYGFELKEEGAKCEFVDGCYEKSDDETRCVKCINGYYLNDKYECKACDKTKCSGGCFHTATTCIDNEMEGCYAYKSETECAKCYEQFELKDGKCVFDFSGYYCYGDGTVNGKCGICVKIESGKDVEEHNFVDYKYPDESGQCPSGTIMNFIMIFALVMMFLF